MPKKILISGATGLVGKQLVPFLQNRGHEVSILSTRKVTIPGVRVFAWDVEQQTIADGALNGIDTIIHLAGEGIADKKWTAERKRKIIDSRVKSAQLLYNTIKSNNLPIETFVSASAVGYYSNRGEEVLGEDSEPGKDFLADCCVKWEAAVDEGLALGINVIKIRIGLILSKEGGALPAMEKPIKWFVGAPLGSGNQWMPWIHLDDIVSLFTQAVEDGKMTGAYNATAPFPVTNKLFTSVLAKKLGRPVWPIHVPKLALDTILGEMSILPLMSSNTVSQKVLDTGFKFKYLDLEEALEEIYG